MNKQVVAEDAVAPLRKWMEGRHLSSVYLTNPMSIAYLTGFFANPHERLMALVVQPREATLIVPALESENAARHATGVSVLAWRDGEDPYALVQDVLGASAEIGVEKQHISLKAAELVTSRTGATEMIDVGGEIRRRRLLKRADEVEKLQRAAAITDAAAEAAFRQMRVGQSESEIAMLISNAIGDREGVLAFPSLVQSGPNSAMPHAQPSNRKLGPGDFVLLDFGAAFDGYNADITRMAVIGEPTTKHREMHDAVLRGHDAAIDAVRAGVTTGDVDAAARRVIDDAGFGELFYHRTGHGLGLEVHEDPSLDPGSQIVLEPGMVFTIEPGVYIAGFGGVRIEDDVVVEEQGCRVLTRADRALRVIKAT